MTTRKLLVTFAVITLLISVPFTIVHMIASPDDAPITLMQHAVAAVANFFGPWGVAIVRLVGFPNAGLRSFSVLLALGLTSVGALLVITALRTARRSLQIVLATCWACFCLVWFTVGLGQIADGLL